MEPSTVQIFLFGDQTNAFEADLRQLLHTKDNDVLNSFLTKANSALRLEINKLSPLQQERFPRFSTLIDLLNGFRCYGSHPALELGLLCLSQLARFIKSVIHTHYHISVADSYKKLWRGINTIPSSFQELYGRSLYRFVGSCRHQYISLRFRACTCSHRSSPYRVQDGSPIR